LTQMGGRQNCCPIKCPNLTPGWRGKGGKVLRKIDAARDLVGLTEEQREGQGEKKSLV